MFLHSYFSINFYVVQKVKELCAAGFQQFQQGEIKLFLWNKHARSVLELEAAPCSKQRAIDDFPLPLVIQIAKSALGVFQLDPYFFQLFVKPCARLLFYELFLALEISPCLLQLLG